MSRLPDEENNEDDGDLSPSQAAQRAFIAGLPPKDVAVTPEQRAEYIRLLNEEDDIEAQYYFITATFENVRYDAQLSELVQVPLKKIGDYCADPAQGDDLEMAVHAYAGAALLLPSGSIMREKLEKKLEIILEKPLEAGIGEPEEALSDFALFRSQTLFIESAYMLGDLDKLTKWKEAWKEKCDEIIGLFPEGAETTINDIMLDDVELPFWCYERAIENLLACATAQIKKAPSDEDEPIIRGPLFAAARLIPKLQADAVRETKYAVQLNNIIVAMQWNDLNTAKETPTVTMENEEYPLEGDIQFTHAEIFQEVMEWAEESASAMDGIIQVMSDIQSPSVQWTNKRLEKEETEETAKMRSRHDRACKTTNATGIVLMRYAFSASTCLIDDEPAMEAIKLMEDLFDRYCRFQIKQHTDKTPLHHMQADIDDRLKLLGMFSGNNAISALIGDWAMARQKQMCIVSLALQNAQSVAHANKCLATIAQKECKENIGIGKSKDVVSRSPSSIPIFN